MQTTSKPKAKSKSKKLTAKQMMLREYFSNAVLIAAISQSFPLKKSDLVNP